MFVDTEDEVEQDDELQGEFDVKKFRQELKIGNFYDCKLIKLSDSSLLTRTF